MVKSFGTVLCLLVSSTVFSQTLHSWRWDEEHPLPYDYLEVGKLDARGAKNVDSLLKELPKYKNIAWLNMWGLGIEELPETIFDSLTTLTWLDIGNNRLETIPPSFDKLTQLTHLGLYGNQLTELPNAVYNMQLVELRAFGNILSGTFTISPAWKNMEQLNISGNDITRLNGLKYLRKVERLALTSCAFLNLPDEFQKCRKLELLYINNNPIEILPKSLLRLPRLRYILLEKTNIPDEILRSYNIKYPKKSFDTCPTC